MSLPILATKLYIPPPRTTLVHRPRLIARLNAGLDRKLTLISAPAGFGKTTLLSDWLNACERPAAWLSLDAGDSDPTRFLSYVIAALRTFGDAIGTDALEMLTSGGAPSRDAPLTTLLNDIATIANPFLLVLDDYHAVEDPAIDTVLAFLLDHLPRQMHLVIATREDPHIPLARLRARDQLTELRIKDLRFTPEEAAGFLNHVMGLDLSVQDIAALETRTEGWIAGLQLVALALQGTGTAPTSDTSSFIEAFTGSHRFVLDYLVEEVLQRQPEAIREFLLKSAILERLSGPLCDAVTGGSDSRKTLDTLERGNLFVVMLDDTRHWYRYHHLFADALRANLINEQPEQVADLHLRACDWYEEKGFPHDAIYHALAAKAFERAADLIERIWPEMDENYQSATWIRWVKALPETWIESRPIISLGYAWALLNRGDIDAAEAHLRAAEHWLNEPETRRESMVVIDEARFQTLPGAIAGARAYGALTLGDIAAAMQYAQQARDLARTRDQASYRQGTALLGIAHWVSGELSTADSILEDFMHQMVEINLFTDAMIAFVLAEIRIVLGRLQDAVNTCEYMLRVLPEDTPSLGLPDLYRALGDLHSERGDLQATLKCIAQAEDLGEDITLPNWDYRLNKTKARIKEAQGDFDAALDLLTTAAGQFTPTPIPEHPSLAAMKTRLWIRQGQLDAATTWAREQGLSVDSEITFMREYDLITLAHLLIAQYRQGIAPNAIQAALKLLNRLQAVAEVGERRGSLIEIHILQALAHEAQGDLKAALIPLKAALTLAQSEGYTRMFTLEGAPMLKLLKAAQDIAPDYVRHLLKAMGQIESRPTPAPSQPLDEPLSEREYDVLRLLATDLSGPEIADELMISLNTMRTHTKNIYGKLGVNSRRAAVRRAEELGLI